ncbi:NAD(P)H-quinone oxidoreductase subunit I, chloroplastic [subsurface metagenome]
MAKSVVALVRCGSYQNEEVYKAVKRGIDLLGGAAFFTGKREHILLKPNVLFGDKPERCSTTNPVVFQETGRLFKESGAELYFGDSPGFGKATTQLKRSGMSRAGAEVGMKEADFDNGREVLFKESFFARKFLIADGVLEAAGLISIGKLKTHQLTRITAAVKNQFGCIPGLIKAKYHVDLADINDFAEMLVALNLFLKPRLYIVDGIMAMEGNGPRSGDPVKMNVLLFSRDPIALDATICRMIDLNPEYVPTMKPGRELGLGTYKSEEIEIVGDPLESFINTGFKATRRPPARVQRLGSISFLFNLFGARPVIREEKCVCCRVCIEVCPVKPKALNWRSGDKQKLQPPVFNYSKCIRCYCCQELCPEKAIYVKTPLLVRFFTKKT